MSAGETEMGGSVEAEVQHYPQMHGKRGSRELRCLCGFVTDAGDRAMEAVQQYAEHVASHSGRADG